MRFGGSVSDYLEDDGTVFEAIVTRKRISIDWQEDGDQQCLMATSQDGQAYRGTFGFGRPSPNCPIHLELFKSKSGEVILIGNWRDDDDGDGGRILFRLFPEVASKSPRRASTKA